MFDKNHLCRFQRIILVLVVGFTITAEAHLGSCEDHTPKCRNWAAWGLCETNLAFMANNCPVSCDVCLDPGCYDRNKRCKGWAAQGICNHHEKDTRDLVRKTCPHSCDICRLPGGSLPATRQSIASPNFECGRPVSNPTFTTNQRITRFQRQIIFPNEVNQFILNNRQNGGSSGDRNNPITRPITSGNNDPIPLINSIDVEDTFCGATLIHEQFVVTAAHCVLDPSSPVRTIRLGEKDFSRPNEPNSNPVDYEVERVIIHQDYDPSTVARYNDIALIKTVEKVQYNQIVYPFCISDEPPLAGDIVTGAGFGFVNNSDRPTNLQEAQFQVVETDACESEYSRAGLGAFLEASYPESIHGKDIICAGFPGRSSCKGDSGGPLFQTDSSGRRFLVGITSQGVSCRGNGVASLPGFYISLASHLDFINHVIYAEEKHLENNIERLKPLLES